MAQQEVTQEMLDELTRAQQRRNFNVHLLNPQGHPGQMRMCYSTKKRIIVRAGRRGGKTTGMAIKAVLAFLGDASKGIPPRRVLYAAPTIDQVSKFWEEVKKALYEPIAHKALYKNETKHIIEPIGSPQVVPGERPRNPRIRAKTAFNAQTLRGDFADLLILDEYQLMDETAWSEVGAPMLIDNNGDVIFIYTPPSLTSRSASKASDPQHAAKMFKEHKDDPDWECIHFSSHENPHVSAEGIDEAAKNLTALAYRQEILAEDTEEVPGALWTRAIIEASRVRGLPCELRRIVIGIDPSGGNRTEVGIGVGGEGVDGHIYFLEDSSLKAARPKEWAERAIAIYQRRMADRIVAERNYGGDMVQETLRNVDESVSYHDVTASKGKMVRAEPILALFQQGRMHLVCSCGKTPCLEFAALEDEMCSYTGAPGQLSPNRMDAMVWVATELSGIGALGLLDWVKSGRAEAMGRRPLPTTQVPDVSQPRYAQEELVKAAAAAAAIVGPQMGCETCHETTMQNVIGGGGIRCGHCGAQYKQAVANRPLGGRRIIVSENSEN